MERIKRIAIVTTAEHSCALYLAANLARADLDICVFSQSAPLCAPDSWGYLNRLLKRRGAVVFADNLLLAMSQRIKYSGLAKRLSVNGNGHHSTHDWPVLKRDDWSSPSLDDRIVRFTDINSKESLDCIHRYSPDLILLAGAPIVCKRLLALPRYGVLNAHCGITPDYAGSSPTVWPLYYNRPYDIGYTIHFVVPQVDSGPIVEQVRLPWRCDWSFQTIASYVLQVMYERLVAVVRQWALTATRPLATPQQVAYVRPPAGKYTYRVAERNRKSLLRHGITVVIPAEWRGTFNVDTDVASSVFQDAHSAKGALQVA